MASLDKPHFLMFPLYIFHPVNFSGPETGPGGSPGHLWSCGFIADYTLSRSTSAPHC